LLSSELIGVDQLLSSILCGERAGMKYCWWGMMWSIYLSQLAFAYSYVGWTTDKLRIPRHWSTGYPQGRYRISQ
jgi:hypothetical protein